MLSTVPNWILWVLKWPVAVLALLLTPCVAWATYDAALWIMANPDPLRGFGLGVSGYLICWWLIFKRQFSGSLFSTAEHEFTHAIFAWLTLHWVTGFRATWNEGGEITYEGRGNWLITIAPYWFPTLCVPILGVMAFTTAAEDVWISAGLGVTLMYHLTSTWRETHAQQSDLQRVGFTFAYLFLPTANLLTLTCIVMFAHSGWSGVEKVYDMVLVHASDLWEMSGAAGLLTS